MKDGFIKVAAISPELRVCDVDFNTEKLLAHVKKATEKGIKILVFPELSITGYTISDLVFQESLLYAVKKSIKRLCLETKGLDIVFAVGAPFSFNSKLYNCAFVINKGKVLAIIPKTNIPGYGEFYETRYYSKSPDEPCKVEYNGEDVLFYNKVLFDIGSIENAVFGVEICEDLWVSNSPSIELARAGATIVLNLSCSDELVGKSSYRRDLVRMQSAKLICAYIYADSSSYESSTDLVFSSHNMIAENGAMLNESRYEVDSFLISEVDVERLNKERMKKSTFIPYFDDVIKIPVKIEKTETVLTRRFDKSPFVPQNEAESDLVAREVLMLQALALKKRLEHTKIKKLVVGLSGGLDSTLALLVMVESFKMLKRPLSDIIAITMPCFGTSKRTFDNAENLASSLGVSFRVIDIKASVEAHFLAIGQENGKYDVTYENAQARERTQVLMDVANMENALVIGTGDLSELALGFATYNGDHMSMYSVNSSVPKTLVRTLVSYYAKNSEKDVFETLSDILLTPVSPELLPLSKNGENEQKTEEIVGPYVLHDFFIYNMVRCSFSPEKIYRISQIAFDGIYDKAVIRKWLISFYRRFFSQQFKRSCLPDGPKVGSVSFSPRSDWRMPSDAEGALWIKEAEALS